jgi:multiple sugar transport system substrate-binding protein
MSSRKLTRREFLTATGAAAVGTALAACATPPTPEPTKPPAPTPPPASSAQASSSSVAPTQAPTPVPTVKKVAGKVVVMTNRGELSDAQIKQFQDANPGITIEYVEANYTRFLAMYAAGNPPDIYRTQAPIIPTLLARKLILDLTDYFKSSSVLKIDDLAPANKYYWADSPLQIGTGKIYGMCKDWSPDFTLFVNTKAFDDAKVPVPDATKPLTYAQVADLAGKVAKFQGDRILTFGYAYADSWIDRIWMNCLAETGKSLFNAGFDQINLGTDEAKALVKYYVDLAEKRLVVNPLDPSPGGWSGQDFANGNAGITQWGYWFQAMAEGDTTKGKVVMLPAPTWTDKRRDPTMTATGWVITATSKNPDAAWKVFEWYMGKEPAVDRAKSGWGVPALKSQMNLLPQGTDFQKNCYKILQGELALDTPPLQFNPFIGEDVVLNAFNKYLDQYLRKRIKFDELLKGMTTEVNQTIKDGVMATVK